METDEADEWLVAGAGKKSWKRRRRKGGPGQHKTAAAATKKKRRSNQQEAAADEWESGPFVWNPAVLDEPVNPREVDALAKGIGACDADLRKSKLYARIKSIFTSQGTDTATFPGAEALFPELRAVEEVVVYGLGSLDMGMTKSSKYQFALTVAIVEEIAKFGRLDRVHFFDPVFTACDRAIIEGQSPKFSVMRENEDCKRSITRKTLFYMPHCEKHHYNNLLRANCGPGSLSNMVSPSVHPFVLQYPTALV